MRALLSWRLARREIRGGLRGFAVFLACLALGVAAVAAVGTVAASLEAALGADARRLLGGDLELRQSHAEPAPEVLAMLRSRGRLSHQVEARAMVFGPDQSAALAEVKAVDAAYPLYGRLELAGPGDPRGMLARRDGVFGALADPVLAERLGVRVGGILRLGEASFVLRGLIAREPDRAARLISLGPRLVVGLPGLEAAGLLERGNLVSHVYKVALPPGADAPALAGELRRRWPQAPWQVRDYLSATTSLERFLGNLAKHLTMLSLAALMLGGVGVAGAVSSHLAAKQSAIAAMKCLGAGRGLVVRIFLWQVLAMALAGSVMGLLVGWLAAQGLLALLEARLGLAAAAELYPKPLLAAAGFGLLTALAFSLGPLSAAGRVSPARLFRGYADARPLRPGGAARLGQTAAFGGLWGLAWAYTGDLRLSLGFAGGAAFCFLVFWAAGEGVARLAARLPRPRDPRLALALANLHRPGASTRTVLLSLGLGLAVMGAVTQVDANFADQIGRQIPAEAPSYFFLGVPAKDLDRFRALALGVPGVLRVEAQPSLRGRIVAINGRPADQARVDPEAAWALRRDRSLTFAAQPPPDGGIVAGRWWPSDYSGPPVMSLDERLARGFGVGLGDTLTVQLLGRPVTARITSLRRIEWQSLSLNHVIVFPPSVMRGAPYSYIATAYAEGTGEADLFRKVTAAFPGVAVIRLEEVLGEVARIMGNVALAVRVTALVTLAAGLLVLAQALSANLRRRHFEAVVFKVFGATRRDVLLSLGAEFLLLGGAAAVIGAGLGSLLSWTFLTYGARGLEWSLMPGPLAATMAVGVAAALILGMWGVRGVLGQKAMPYLRNE